MSDPDPGDSIVVSVSGLPPGMTLEVTRVSSDLRVATVSGTAPSSPEQVNLVWDALDSHGLDSRSTTVLSVTPPVSGDVRVMARQLAKRRYKHGIPGGEVRNLGPSALPYFLEILRDTTAKSYWSNAVLAAGFLGVPAAYDSLHAFIWDRFHGEVDALTLKALLYAQAVLGVVEPSRPEIFDYLVQSSNPAYWQRLPWHDRHVRKLGLLMSGRSIYALSVIPEGRVDIVLNQLRSGPPDRELLYDIDEALQGRSAILARGWLAVREERRSAGGP